MHFPATTAAAAVLLITVTVCASTVTSSASTPTTGISQVGLNASESSIASGNSPRAAAAPGQSCGLSKYTDAGNMALPTQKIVGGQQARRNEFPYQVSMRYNGRHRCGGSIVAPSLILTAAHCVSSYTLSQIQASVTIAVGEHQLSETVSTVRQVFRVRDMIMGDYDSETLVNDIALLQLSGSITFNENVAPVCLPASTSSFDFRKSVASGWGYTFSESSTISDVLLYTTLNITTNNICNSIFYDNYNKNRIASSMLCARDNINDYTRDTCQGDSGGPLAVKGVDGTFTLAGITSWGITCAAGYPGVYTRVSSCVDSVREIINSGATMTTTIKCDTTWDVDEPSSAKVATSCLITQSVMLAMMSLLF